MLEKEVIALLKSINTKLDMLIEALQPHREYKGTPEGELLNKTFKELIVKEEPQVSEEIIVEYDGRTYKKFKPCKYKCGFWTSWATDYKKGDKILHINPMSKEIIGFNCPKFEGG